MSHGRSGSGAGGDRVGDDSGSGVIVLQRGAPAVWDEWQQQLEGAPEIGSGEEPQTAAWMFAASATGLDVRRRPAAAALVSVPLAPGYVRTSIPELDCDVLTLCLELAQFTASANLHPATTRATADPQLAATRVGDDPQTVATHASVAQLSAAGAGGSPQLAATPVGDDPQLAATRVGDDPEPVATHASVAQLSAAGAGGSPQNISWQQLLVPGRRTFVLSFCGEIDGCWYDGPLAHVLANGDLASYVPSGGLAALGVKVTVPHGLVGASLTRVDSLEGLPGEQIRRWLLAQICHRLAAGYVGAGSDNGAVSDNRDNSDITSIAKTNPIANSTLHLALPALTRSTAAYLCLVRQARPDLQIVAYWPKSLALPPPWRRFAQHIGVTLLPEPAPAAAGRAVSAVALQALVPPLSTAQADALLAAVNSISDVLPKTLL